MTLRDALARAARVALASLAVWAAAAATLWLHALAGIPGDYLERPYPVYPGLTVTRANLALDAAATTVPVFAAAVLARALSLRVAALPLIGFLWLWAGMALINSFSIDFGNTWRPTELLRALFLHPVYTPLALAVLMAATYAALAPRRSQTPPPAATPTPPLD